MKGYFWTGSRPGGDVFFDWHASRGGECLDAVVPVDFRGTVQCDGYAAYNRLAARPGQAILYTIIESCRRRGVEPFAYLKDVLTRLPQMTNKQVAQLLPSVWGKPTEEPLRKAS